MGTPPSGARSGVCTVWKRAAGGGGGGGVARGEGGGGLLGHGRDLRGDGSCGRTRLLILLRTLAVLVAINRLLLLLLVVLLLLLLLLLLEVLLSFESVDAWCLCTWS